MNTRKLTVTILSLSLLTVMAGAAVAPALDVIKNHFSTLDSAYVQMVISMPALFIALTNLVFPRLCRRFDVRTLLLMGLGLYVVGGCAAGLFDNFALVMVFRALVGVAVGIIMPLSTGLLSYYFEPEKQHSLMGLSSAMNQMGAVIATLISGALASISWRASFLVYLMGLPSFILCLAFMPADKLGGREGEQSRGVFRENFAFIAVMFMAMFVFFVYPSSFAMETVKAGKINPALISVIMAGMDFVAFLGGLSFAPLRRRCGSAAAFLAPACFLVGYVLLIGRGLGLTLLGSALIGFANGLEIPYLISTASMRVGKTAATTVVPMLSIALYLAQFFTPVLLSALSFMDPFMAAALAAALLVLCSVFVRK